RLVPARAVLAAAADVGQHVGAAALEPGPADPSQVGGGQGDLEAAVSVQQGGLDLPGLDPVRAGDLEVRDAGAVVADREVLADIQALRVEALRRGFDELELAGLSPALDLGEVAQQQPGGGD